MLLRPVMFLHVIRTGNRIEDREQYILNYNAATGDFLILQSYFKNKRNFLFFSLLMIVISSHSLLTVAPCLNHVCTMTTKIKFRKVVRAGDHTAGKSTLFITVAQFSRGLITMFLMTCRSMVFKNHERDKCSECCIPLIR